MSKESLAAFRAKLAEDETLRQEASRTFGGGPGRAVAPAEELVAFAKARGYDFSVHELEKSVELDDSELEGVAGGASYAKLEGIDGESTDSKHKGEIELLSWSFVTSSTR